MPGALGMFAIGNIRFTTAEIFLSRRSVGQTNERRRIGRRLISGWVCRGLSTDTCVFFLPQENFHVCQSPCKCTHPMQTHALGLLGDEIPPIFPNLHANGATPRNFAITMQNYAPCANTKQGFPESPRKRAHAIQLPTVRLGPWRIQEDFSPHGSLLWRISCGLNKWINCPVSPRNSGILPSTSFSTQREGQGSKSR